MHEMPRREFLGGAAGLIAALAAGGCATMADSSTKPSAQSMPKFAYVGSYTTKERNGHGEGINVYEVDPGTGSWTHVQLLKDVVNRTQQMLGKDAPYVPGWDCHGLPIEWKIEEEYRAFAGSIGLTDIVCIPLSAKKGDNVTSPSTNTPWYRGPTLMDYLETVEIDRGAEDGPLRMPVQWGNRPNLDFRGFSGRLVGGAVRVGERVRVLPSAKESVVTRLVTQDGDLERAIAGQSITITLRDEIDVSRGDLLCSAESPASVADQFEATVVWMSEDEMLPGRPYLLKIGAKTVGATIAPPKYKVNVNSLEHLAAKTLHLNEIGVCNLNLDQAIAETNQAEDGLTAGIFSGNPAEVARFFDDVMVMDPDPLLRDNRLALLRSLHELFSPLADFSRLQVEKSS